MKKYYLCNDCLETVPMKVENANSCPICLSERIEVIELVEYQSRKITALEQENQILKEELADARKTRDH